VLKPYVDISSKFTHVTDRLVISYCIPQEECTREAKMLNINTIMKMGFVDRVHVQRTIIFLERGVQEEEGKKDIRY